ncbi:hypothetical protein OSCI_20007 [Kamptonema sp. PCC 6506]|nr:hypothetical protein OSCI_20007 [Kamptonema sp. PCC 6506]
MPVPALVLNLTLARSLLTYPVASSIEERRLSFLAAPNSQKLLN